VSWGFTEDKKHKTYEKFYVNSYIEWLATMPKLNKAKLKTTKLNFAYCSFLQGQGNFENLKSIEWIDDSLDQIKNKKKDCKAKI